MRRDVDDMQAIEEPFILAVKHTLGDQYTASLDRLYRRTMHFILTILTIGFRQVMALPRTPSNRPSVAVTPSSSSYSGPEMADRRLDGRSVATTTASVELDEPSSEMASS